VKGLQLVNGIWRSRKVVPREVAAIVGKSELTRTTGVAGEKDDMVALGKARDVAVREDHQGEFKRIIGKACEEANSPYNRLLKADPNARHLDMEEISERAAELGICNDLFVAHAPKSPFEKLLDAEPSLRNAELHEITARFTELGHTSAAKEPVAFAVLLADCTGDGDIFHRAGAGSDSDIDERDIHHCINTAWLFGGVDMPRWIAFKTGDPDGFKSFMERGRAACGGLFERPFVSWRDDVALFMGPRLAGYSAVDVEDQTEVEIRSHRLMAQHLAVYREHAPGFAGAYLMLSAPQLGVRHARRLVGVGRVTREDWPDGAPRPDEIGISPSLSPKFPLVSVPYGCLVPRDIDGLLVADRHISCDATSHSFLREIPQCWLTGQAAAAAALAAAEKCEPRAVPTAVLQALLLRQGVVLRQAAETAPAAK
jgi:FAD dependent oxidoreductase